MNTVTVELHPENISAELKLSHRWVLWTLADVEADGKLRKDCKPPYQVNGRPAKHNDPSTWSSFDEVVAAHAARVPFVESKGVTLKEQRGIGLVIGPPFVGIDIDDCRNPETGELDPFARQLVEELATYTEVSPSGTGLHLWIHGEPPYVQGHRKNNVEIYSTNRYLTMTGVSLPGTPGDVRRFDKSEIAALYARIKAGNLYESHKFGESPKFSGSDNLAQSANFRESRNFGGSPKLAELMTRTDFADLSEASMSLMTALAYKNCDPAWIAAEYQKSAIYNETHWKEKFTRFGEQEIEKAIQWVKTHPRSEESRSLITTWMNAVQAKPLRYLWKPVFPIGHITCFAGRSSEGKSPVSLDILARLTRGGVWPDGTPNTNGPKKAILMNIEDGLEDMIAPRFKLADGVPENLCAVRGVRVQKKDSVQDGLLALDRDVHLLCDLARSIDNLGMLVIDPITQYLGGAKMNADDDLRRVLGPLIPLAEELQIAIVWVCHFNKRGDTTDPLARVQGGNAFVGMARSVYVFSEDKSKDKYAHIMSPARSKEKSYHYHTEQVPQVIEGVPSDVIKIVWDGTSETHAETAIEESQVSKRTITVNRKAADELEKFLQGGKRDSAECIAFLKSCGFKTDDLDFQRVRKYAGVRGEQCGRKSFWFLPTAAQEYQLPLTRENDAPKF